MVAGGNEALGRIEAFQRSLGRYPWFAAAGAPLAPGEYLDVHTYLASLDLDRAPVAAVGRWADAKRLAHAPEWDRRWWDREEMRRQDAIAAAEARCGHGLLMTQLSGVTLTAADVVHDAAARAAQRAGCADRGLVRAAAGAAVQACYLAALAMAAGAGEDHAFAAKLRLFSAGRWPLGLLGGRFLLF